MPGVEPSSTAVHPTILHHIINKSREYNIILEPCCVLSISDINYNIRVCASNIGNSIYLHIFTINETITL